MTKYRAWYENSQTWVYCDISKGFSEEGLENYQVLIKQKPRFYKFTGFKDCENKDIYEGDILASRLEGDTEKAYVVEWSELVGAFWINDTLLSRHLHNEQYGLKYKQSPKIVGNIYENKIGDLK